MRILIVTQYFWPEEFRINDLAISLVERGYDVTVLTGNPNYPKGKFVEGYGFRWSKEIYKGINILRVPIIPRGKNSLMLFLNYLSFIVTGSIFSFFHKKKYDKVFAVNFSPITAVIPAIVYCKKNKKELSIWVQDLWPESVVAASSIKSNRIQKLLTRLVKYIYKRSNKIFISNNGFKESLIDKGVDEGKIYYMPNWAEDIFESKKNLKINRKQYSIPEGFVVMFAGNLGEAQDLEAVLKAAELTKNNKNIKWVFVGDGRKGNWLKNNIKDKKLSDTVKVLGRFPMEQMPLFFKLADVMLVSLKDEYIFSLTVPSKVQSYMASKKPILSMLNGAGNDIIKESGSGFVANAGDYQTLAENVVKCENLSVEKIESMGQNSFEYYQRHFSKNKIVDSFIKSL
ncbi:glycosyltransferase family 4 protein [Tenacibaculum caenipelagi]|uniref:Glycosyltransferase involved in cell wall biosynthesis n=1 Tax=Tenacibaculum caenipelagi TaxID=1325435 RepID=A0A4R6TFF8_9FLAO|nr:glycosyltransferase family 4 protein [Tenacibaculum caenipelagi]TDQ24093.1 glycosyltransferase involved in cell wall biosynthesis [Tenacibaculum caenipelagi]